MSDRLSDTERTLLSGYLDSEVSSAERQGAEGLLARSKDAEAYLNDLRSLRSVAHEAFPPMFGAGIAGAAFSAKLTGGSIASAAGKTIAVKGLFAGSWGMASIASAAASIGVVMALNFGGGRIDNSGDNLRPVSASQSAPASHSSAAIAADTGSLVVPSMTPDELVGFAVKGTLPIDPNRNRYLTVQTKGKDSFRLELHQGSPNELANQFKEVHLAETPQLENVEQAIRRSVKAFPNGSIGLRNDIWNNRQQLVNLLRERNLRPDLDLRLAAEHRRLAEFRAARAAQVARFQQQVQVVAQVSMIEQGWSNTANINGVILHSVMPNSQQAWNVWESRTFPVIIQPDAFPPNAESVASWTMGCSNNPVVVQGDNVMVSLFDSPVFDELQNSLPAELLLLSHSPENPETAAAAPTEEAPRAIPVKIARPRPRGYNWNQVQQPDAAIKKTPENTPSINVITPPDQEGQVVIIRTQEILEHARQQLQRADSLLRQLRQDQNLQQPENSSKQP